VAAALIGYFDCFSGASGDMILGSLVDAGLDVDWLRSELARLGMDGYELRAERVVRSGLAGTQMRVELQQRTQPSRNLADIEQIIARAGLSGAIKERATRVFRALGRAEAQVHGLPVERLHFHEVGAVDAVVDIVGACIGLDGLGIEQLYASSLPLGGGMLGGAHGKLPLPAPATLALIAAASAPTRTVATEMELVTPTGAAILTGLATFCQPSMAIERVGTGFGTRELPWPNVLRLWLGQSIETDLQTDEVTVIETNLDDLTPEQAGYAMDRLLAAGALDVFFTPVQMKKNRPGVMLTVLAAPAEADRLAGVVLRETTSLGVRLRASRRIICPRRTETIATRLGDMQVKIKTIEGRDIVCPEFEECARVARENNIPIGDVYAAVLAAGLS
jgi:pyridinium-3,5-bisthiocarboxylic acid mononucleotide nickel chelatase